METLTGSVHTPEKRYLYPLWRRTFVTSALVIFLQSTICCLQERILDEQVFEPFGRRCRFGKCLCRIRAYRYKICCRGRIRRIDRGEFPEQLERLILTLRRTRTVR